MMKKKVHSAGIAKKANTTTKSKTTTIKKVTLGSLYKISKNTLSRTNSDNSISIIKTDSDKNFYTLDGIAAEVWNQLNGKASLELIATKISKQYDVSLTIVNKDINNLIEQLLDRDLINKV